MMPSTPLQYELSQLVMRHRNRKEKKLPTQPQPAQTGLDQGNPHGRGRVMMWLGGWWQKTTRPFCAGDPTSEGGMAI